MKIKKFGYQASALKKITCNIIFFLLDKVFQINGNNKFSNMLLQIIEPKSYVSFNKHKLIFRTGNERLYWRVKNFYKEEPLMIEWLKKMNQKDIFLDIGSNIGLYTIPASKFCKEVYACELDPLNLAILKENIFLNKSQNKVLLIPFAMIEKNMVIDVFYRDLAYGDALQSIDQDQKVPTIKYKNKHKNKQLGMSLDNIFKLFKLKYPNKIKIDVDGNESGVIWGGRETLKKASEIYYEYNETKNNRILLNFFLKNSFKIVKEQKNNNFISGSNLLLKKVN